MYMKKFIETEPYQQEGGKNVSYHALLPKNEVKDIAMGWVRIKGKGSTPPNSHTEWEQCYVILSGEGTLWVNKQPYPLKEKMIVHIPLDAEHYVTVSEKKELEYIYINKELFL